MGRLLFPYLECLVVEPIASSGQLLVPDEVTQAVGAEKKELLADKHIVATDFEFVEGSAEVKAAEKIDFMLGQSQRVL